MTNEAKSHSREQEREILSSHHPRRHIFARENPHHRRLRREGAHFGDEGARRGDHEMGAHRGHIRPLLDKDEAVGLFDIDMAVVRQTPRLAARPRAMLGAERDHALAMLGGQDGEVGDET
jgi:hypothetical protein